MDTGDAANDRALGFRRTRNDHLHETAADYCELIEELIADRGEARSVDLAARLGVHQVTVGKTIRRLAREGYVSAEPYRSVFLTEKGQELARASREKHELTVGLLRKLGVPEDVAEVDAEGIEHHLSDATLAAIRRFCAETPESGRPESAKEPSR